jgi:hypothetical protein
MMNIITDVKPVTAFIGGEESILDLLEQYRAAEARQMELLAATIQQGVVRESTACLLETIERLECELEETRRELAAVRAGRDRLLKDYRRLAGLLGPANIEEQE